MPDEKTARKWWALAENVILSDPHEDREGVAAR
jgi:L-rhamnose mutarotase